MIWFLLEILFQKEKAIIFLLDLSRGLDPYKSHHDSLQWNPLKNSNH